MSIPAKNRFLHTSPFLLARVLVADTAAFELLSYFKVVSKSAGEVSGTFGEYQYHAGQLPQQTLLVEPGSFIIDSGLHH